MIVQYKYPCSGDGACAEELAYYLANVDQRPLLPGKQTINTHVIGGFLMKAQTAQHLTIHEEYCTSW